MPPVDARKMTSLCAGVAFSAVLVGCSGTSHPGTPSASTDAPGIRSVGATIAPKGVATTASPDKRSASVIRDYAAYWVALVKASDPPNPKNPLLAAHAAGTELDRAEMVLTARQQSHQVVRGRFGHSPEVTSIDGPQAKLFDCLVPRTSVYDSKTGKKLSSDPGKVLAVTASLVLTNGIWRVSLIAPSPRACGAGGTPPAGAPPAP